MLSISTSPSIIVVVINDVMGITGLAEPNALWSQWFSGQQEISNILIYITFVFLPVMLCAIPCTHICCGKKHDAHEDQFDQVNAAGRDENQQLLRQDDDADDNSASMTDVEQMLMKHCPKEENHDNLGEIFIH